MSALTSPDETLIQNEIKTETLLAERLLEFANEAFVFSSDSRKLTADQSPKRYTAPPRSYFADVTPPPLAPHHLKNTRVVPSREHILPFLAKGGICADIGTGTGDFAWHLLSVLEPAKLHLCDRNFHLFDSSICAGALERGVVELHEGDPHDYLNIESDGHFDLICLYPGHSHVNTTRMLEQAARKLKSDGCIICANYTTYAPLEGIKYGVARAVHEFCHSAGFEIAFLALNPFGLQDVALRKSSESPGTPSLEVPDSNSYQPDIWEYLIAKYDVRTVLDIGAGAGWSTKWFVDRGIYALGVERSKEALSRSKCRGNIIEHDYRLGPFVPSMVLDLAWCAGLAEPIEEEHIPHFMASLKSCRFVCLAHAEQKDANYWIRKMDEFGFDHDAIETARLRSTDKNQGPLGRRALTFFKRREPGNNS